MKKRSKRDADIRSLRGMVRTRRKGPVPIAEMNEAIAEGYAGRKPWMRLAGSIPGGPSDLSMRKGFSLR
jgi:hypothetical protein